MELKRLGRVENVSVDTEQYDPLVKVLDAGKRVRDFKGMEPFAEETAVKTDIVSFVISEKNLLLWCKFFLLRVDPFSEGLFLEESTHEVICLPCTKCILT